jgi:polyisoprenoid-binding protein YceI
MYIHERLKSKKSKPMKVKFLLPVAIVMAAAGTFAFTLVNNPWKVDTAAAKITWDQPLAKHNGTFSGLNATVDFDPMNPGTAIINASVDANTVNAGNEKLDAHLKSKDFFDAEKHPRISFTADQVIKTDTGFIAVGRLALRDSIRAVMVPFKMIQDGNKAILKGTMTIYSGDYGVGKKSKEGNDITHITIEVPVTKE